MELAVTVIGPDRPGIVADVAGALSALGANLTDSTMTRLRGHFAMTLICTTSADAAQVESALDGLDDLIVTVREVGQDRRTPATEVSFLLSVHGADRLGIVAAVTRAIADAGGNITDLSTRLTGSLYVLLAEVDLPVAAMDPVNVRLAELAAALEVEVSLRPIEADLL
ncbi:glycine cleavage system protein R [Rhizocola hellebori]|nr:ACT domain-containing protein [Rhizocola hellebori]